jgi:hypothetical protein
VSAASFRLGTMASSVSAAVGESNLQAASATVSSLGAKTRGAVSSTVSFLQEKGVVSGAHGLVASAGSTAKSVFALAQSGVCLVSRQHNEMICLTYLRQWQGFWGSAASESEAESASHAIVSDSIQVEVILWFKVV